MSFLPLPTNLFPYWFFPWNTNSWNGFTQFIFHKELLALDSVRQLFPWKVFGFELMKNGQWPLWNPYAFSGQPLLANLQSSFFYPLTWFFLFLSSDHAWSVYIYLQPIILATGMFFWFKVKKYSLFTTIIVTSAIIFSSFFVTRYFWGVYLHSLIWIPWGLFLVEGASKTRRFALFTTGTAVVYGLTILGGYPQHSIFALIIMISFTTLKLGLWGVLATAMALLLSLGLTSIQLLPSLELYQYSARDTATSITQFVGSQLSLSHLVTLFSPDYYGSPGVNNFFGRGDYSGVNNYFGIVPMILALASLFLKKSREQMFWFGIVIYGFLASYATPISLLPKILNLPILSTGAAWNNNFFIQFGGAILGGFAIEKLLQSDRRSTIRVAGLIVALLSGGILFMSFPNSISFKNTLPYVAIAMFAFFATFLPIKWLKISLTILIIVPGIYLFSKISPFGEQKYFYPDHPAIAFLRNSGGINRFWGIGGQSLPTNLATYYRIYDAQGYDSLWPKWYGEFVAASGDSPKTTFDRAIVNIPKEDTLKTKKLTDFLGIKYYLDQSENLRGDDEVNTLKYTQEKFTRVRRFGQVNIFENKQALPRVFFIDTAYYAPVSTHIEKFYENTFNPKSEVLVASQKNYEKSYARGEIKITSYNPNEVIFATTVPTGEGMLVLSDTYYPGWKVFIDDTETKMHRANYAFRSVVVPKGNHVVRFMYDPQPFKDGKLVSTVSFIIVISILVLSVAVRKKTIKK